MLLTHSHSMGSVVSLLFAFGGTPGFVSRLLPFCRIDLTLSAALYQLLLDRVRTQGAPGLHQSHACLPIVLNRPVQLRIDRLVVLCRKLCHIAGIRLGWTAHQEDRVRQ